MEDVLDIGTFSTAGRREENQDNYGRFEAPFGYVVVVADGMGGHRGGRLASHLAVSRLPELLAGQPDELELEPQRALAGAIGTVNMEIHEQGRLGSNDESRAMGTTLALLALQSSDAGTLAMAANVGDSRVYFFRNGGLFLLTRDHTAAQDLFRSGAISAEQAAVHPRAHVLTRALGHSMPLKIDFSPWIQPRPGDMFLLCSDGLSGYVPDAMIGEVLRADGASPSELAERLGQLALQSDSTDNVTVAVVRFR